MSTDLFKHRPSVNSFLKSFVGYNLVLLMISCSVFATKDNYIKDFSSFINDVKGSCANYSEADWTNADKQYKEFANDKYEKFKTKLTTEDELTIIKLKGTYAAFKVKKGAGELFDQAKELLNQAGEVLDSKIKTTNK